MTAPDAGRPADVRAELAKLIAADMFSDDKIDCPRIANTILARFPQLAEPRVTANPPTGHAPLDDDGPTAITVRVMWCSRCGTMYDMGTRHRCACGPPSLSNLPAAGDMAEQWCLKAGELQEQIIVLREQLRLANIDAANELAENDTLRHDCDLLKMRTLRIVSEFSVGEPPYTAEMRRLLLRIDTLALNVGEYPDRRSDLIAAIDQLRDLLAPADPTPDRTALPYDGSTPLSVGFTDDDVQLRYLALPMHPANWSGDVMQIAREAEAAGRASAPAPREAGAPPRQPSQDELMSQGDECEKCGALSDFIVRHWHDCPTLHPVPASLPAAPSGNISTVDYAEAVRRGMIVSAAPLPAAPSDGVTDEDVAYLERMCRTRAESRYRRILAAVERDRAARPPEEK